MLVEVTGVFFIQRPSERTLFDNILLYTVSEVIMQEW